MPVLRAKRELKRRIISVRINTSLAEDIDLVKSAAEQKGLVFDVAAIVERALSQAVNDARRELEPSK